MKRVVIILSIISLLSIIGWCCYNMFQFAKEEGEYAVNRKIDDHTREIIINSTERTDSNSNKPFNFNKYLNCPKTSKLAKEIFLNKNWKLDDTEMLSFLDSLCAKDTNARPFYFRVVTNSYLKSDGAYSEGLGIAGKEYIENHTHEFAHYFESRNIFTDKDLATWADISILEFSIIADNECQNSIINSYSKKLISNCKSCSKSEKQTIEKYISLLKQKWKEYQDKK